MLTRIHVNQHHIRSNKKNGTDLPPITVKTYKSNDYARSVDILDDNGDVLCSVKYTPESPLSCGATVYIETKNKVVMHV